jgi:hypothetical protein
MKYSKAFTYIRLVAGLLQVSINCLKAKGEGEGDEVEVVVDPEPEAELISRCNLPLYQGCLY